MFTFLKTLGFTVIVFLIIISSTGTPYNYSNQVILKSSNYFNNYVKPIRLRDLINTTLPILFLYPYIDHNLIVSSTLPFISLGEDFDIDKVLGREQGFWTKTVDHDKAYVVEYERAVFAWTSHGFYYYKYIDSESLPSKSLHILLSKNLTKLTDLLTSFLRNRYVDERITYNGSSNGYDVFYIYFGQYRLAYPFTVKGIDVDRVDKKVFLDKVKIQSIIGYLPPIINRENLVFNMSIFNEIKVLVSKALGREINDLYIYDAYLLPLDNNPYIVAPILKIGLPDENVTVRIRITDKNITIYNITRKPSNTIDLFQIPYNFDKILEEHGRNKSLDTVIILLVITIAVTCPAILIVLKVIKNRK